MKRSILILLLLGFYNSYSQKISKVVVIRICDAGESSLLAKSVSHIDLPDKSPKEFENTVREPEKYAELNKQIAIEMLYLGQKIKELMGRQ